MDDPKLIYRRDNPDFLVISGSRLYGYSSQNADYDYRGFISVPYPYLLGRQTFNQFEENIPEQKKDRVIYSLPKFFSLLERSTPNIIELLFTDSKNILRCNKTSQLLLQNRHLFVSKYVINPFLGFSTSEWQKVKHPERGEKGEARRNLIAKYGYDVKSACHAIRLLSEAIQLLCNGEIIFPLSNAQFLLEIRSGKYKLEELQPVIDDQITLINNLMEKSNNIPPISDKIKINELYYQLISKEMEPYIHGYCK